MKKRLIVLSLAGLLSSHQLLYAGETSSEIDEASLKSTATGVLIGGLLGGPVGAFAGLVGGALIGEINEQKGDIVALNEALEVSRQNQEEQHQALAERHQAYKKLMVEQRSQLSALESGFSFCLGFRSDSADIEPKIGNQLASLAVMLQAFPELNLQILASADRRGGEEYNRVLSRGRAEAVANLLIEAGLPASRISIHYRGEEGAAYPLRDIEGLGFDRVVQLTLVKGDAS